MFVLSQIQSRGFRCSCTVLAGALVGLLGVLPATVNATLYDLEDGNSKLRLDTVPQATGYDWFVDGIDHLTEFSNWYRIEGETRETAINDLNMNILSEFASNTNGDIRNDKLTVVYEDFNQIFQIVVEYKLIGGPTFSGRSTVTECFTINNISGDDLNLHLFEYVDWDLNAIANDDLAMFTGAASLKQFDAVSTFQASYPLPSHREIAIRPFTRNHLINNSPSTLNDMPAASFVPVGPANVTWAVQWDFSLSPGGQVHFCKRSRCTPTGVPEPTSWALAALGVTAFVVASRRPRLHG